MLLLFTYLTLPVHTHDNDKSSRRSNILGETRKKPFRDEMLSHVVLSIHEQQRQGTGLVKKKKKKVLKKVLVFLLPTSQAGPYIYAKRGDVSFFLSFLSFDISHNVISYPIKRWR